MLAYGSAEASLRLLWKFGLLEVLLPIQVQAHPSSAHAIALSSYPFMHLKHLSDYRDVIALHRLHTLFHKDFEDVTSDQICYWYVLRLSLLASYMLQCQTHQLLFFFFFFVLTFSQCVTPSLSSRESKLATYCIMFLILGKIIFLAVVSIPLDFLGLCGLNYLHLACVKHIFR